MSRGRPATLYSHTAKRLIKTLGQGNQQIPTVWNRPIVSGGGASFYKAAEDIAPSRDWFWANPCSRTGVVSDSNDFVKIYNWESLLDHMRAGYVMTAISINGELVFNQGPCIPTTCASSGATVTADSAPQGTVGEEYTYTFSTGGLSGPATATGLPPGLTLSGTTVSGTPTTAGGYYLRITGPATGSCNVTRIVLITIAEPE